MMRGQSNREVHKSTLLYVLAVTFNYKNINDTLLSQGRI